MFNKAKAYSCFDVLLKIIGPETMAKFISKHDLKPVDLPQARESNYPTVCADHFRERLEDYAYNGVEQKEQYEALIKALKGPLENKKSIENLETVQHSVSLHS